MRRMLKGIHGSLVVFVDLYALQYLEVRSAVLAGDYERASTRLPFVLYHSADTYRPVELAAEKFHPFCRISY